MRAAAVGRRGAVVVGEEGPRRGCYGGVAVADRYESYDAWKAVAAVGAGIAIGTMLAKPPAAATPSSSPRRPTYYQDGVFYTKVMSSGTVVYQVVEPGGRNHHDATRRLQERERLQRGVSAVRHDPLLTRIERISGSRTALISFRSGHLSHR